MKVKNDFHRGSTPYDDLHLQPFVCLHRRRLVEREHGSNAPHSVVIRRVTKLVYVNVIFIRGDLKVGILDTVRGVVIPLGE